MTYQLNVWTVYEKETGKELGVFPNEYEALMFASTLTCEVSISPSTESVSDE